ncbi:Putative F0F1-ATPase subunit (ATPase_gene1) [Maioricimonas rarisocia]|uniref:F0F1-ATPase subunit (ATPase_gene1) n=1 Tax=Maioricimonas rarisocia TaxID=2528026 RepID=A0A517Z1C3_9PLAN|nr:AtpZ/AtpI family protein [Maioricimonas rarisocia]QDU36268.1 Putative F0F1-ATPase subunit (ATPase_gene1) [Maioricimonas rarisocia]
MTGLSFACLGQFVPPSRSKRPSSMAAGMYWAARVSSIAMTMAVPPALGFWADHHWGTAPWLVVVGACLGFVVAMLEIFKLASPQRSDSE